MTIPIEGTEFDEVSERQGEQASLESSLAASDVETELNVETEIVMQLGASLLLEPPREVTVIDVQREADTVTLQGQVDSSVVRDMAGDVADRHPDVDTTINDLEVSPLPKQDLSRST